MRMSELAPATRSPFRIMLEQGRTLQQAEARNKAFDASAFYALI